MPGLIKLFFFQHWVVAETVLPQGQKDRAYSRYRNKVVFARSACRLVLPETDEREMALSIARDRDGGFEPQLVKKGELRFTAGVRGA